MPPKKRRANNDGIMDDNSQTSTPLVKRRRKATPPDPVDICQELYEAIRSHKTQDGRLLCESFHRLPNRRTEPEYYEKISEPIDLTRVQNKMKNEDYDDIDQMCNDIQLIVNNAKLYYAEDSTEHGDAVALENLYNEVKMVVLARKACDESESTGDSGNTDTTQKYSGDNIDNMDESTSDLIMELADDDDDDADEETEDNAEEDDAEDESSNQIGRKMIETPDEQKEPIKLIIAPKKKRGRGRPPRISLPESVTEGDSTSSTNVKPGVGGRMSLREKEPQDFRSLISPRSGRRLSRDSSVSRDDDQANSVTDDESGPYEDLLSSIVNAKEGERPICEMFKILPHREIFPGYYSVITEPMDLKTIAQKIQRNEYTCTDDMFKDLILMVNNAKQFNKPGSQIYRDAASLRRLIVEKKIEMTTQQPRPGGVARPSRMRAKRGGQSERLSAIIAALELDKEPIDVKPNISMVTADAVVEEASDTEGSLAEEIDSPLWALYSAAKKHRDSTGRVLSEPFIRLPNRRMYPDYYEEIEKPISLLKIRARLKNAKYKTVEKVLSDLDRLFENAKRYNQDESKIHQDAVKLQGIVHKKYKEMVSLNSMSATGVSNPVPKKKKVPTATLR